LWQSFEFGLSAPRQNGKGEVLMARELFGLFVLGERFIVHSAHEFKTSVRHFKRIEEVIRRNPDLLARMKRSPVGQQRIVGFLYSHGDESVELQDGAKIEFRTRTKSGLKGVDDVALLVLDEAQILSEWAHGTMVPTLRASTAERGPQLVYAGNAPDKEKDDHAIVWTRLRDRGLERDDGLFLWRLLVKGILEIALGEIHDLDRVVAVRAVHLSRRLVHPHRQRVRDFLDPHLLPEQAVSDGEKRVAHRDEHLHVEDVPLRHTYQTDDVIRHRCVQILDSLRTQFDLLDVTHLSHPLSRACCTSIAQV
jgi:hypothetical protein